MKFKVIYNNGDSFTFKAKDIADAQKYIDNIDVEKSTIWTVSTNNIFLRKRYSGTFWQEWKYTYTLYQGLLCLESVKSVRDFDKNPHSKKVTNPNSRTKKQKAMDEDYKLFKEWHFKTYKSTPDYQRYKDHLYEYTYNLRHLPIPWRGSAKSITELPTCSSEQSIDLDILYGTQPGVSKRNQSIQDIIDYVAKEAYTAVLSRFNKKPHGFRIGDRVLIVSEHGLPHNIPIGTECWLKQVAHVNVETQIPTSYWVSEQGEHIPKDIVSVIDIERF